MADGMRADAPTRRLQALADELRRVGGAIADCDFRRPEARALPLRPTPATSALAAGPPRALPSSSASSTSSTSPASGAAPGAPGSLFSVVSAAAYSAKRSAASQRPQSWQDALRRLAAELAAPEAMERFERLRRRHESLAATTRLLEERLRRPADEVTLNDRVESQLEREEQEWEAQMQVREQAVAELEVELKALRDDEQESDGEQEGEEDEEGEEEDEQEGEREDEQETKTGEGRRDVARMEARGRELREALALRAEEKRDIEAAIDSLRRKRRRRAPSNADELDAGEGAKATRKRPRVESERSRELEGELITLRAEKDALEREILDAERRSEELDEHKSELPALREEMDALQSERDALQTRVETRRLQVARLKHKMRHMVDVQLLTARDTSPPTLREEAVLLQLLYEHEGELGVNELKQRTAAVMQEHGKPPNSAAVIRALYSLVANGVVQIDRSYGNGLVTSLLV